MRKIENDLRRRNSAVLWPFCTRRLFLERQFQDSKLVKVGRRAFLTRKSV